MHRFLPLLFLVCCFTACQRTFQPDDEAAIRHVMADQVTAWDSADIDGFMKGYAEDICFISSKRGKQCGKAEVTASYKKGYPDKDHMGSLTFGIYEVLPAGSDHAWCTGSWQLIRAADTLGGGFSLLWQRKAEGWRIIRDHTY